MFGQLFIKDSYPKHGLADPSGLKQPLADCSCTYF